MNAVRDDRIADWASAPPWARFFAIDSDGEAWWFENRPHLITPDGFPGKCWFESDGGRAERVNDVAYIEERPPQ